MITALTGEVIFRCRVIKLLRHWLVVVAFAVGKVARATELFCGLDSDSPMNRFCVAALARLHPICARHRRNIPLEMYSTVGGTGWSRPDESVLYPAKSPQCLIDVLIGQVVFRDPLSGPERPSVHRLANWRDTPPTSTC